MSTTKTTIEDQGLGLTLETMSERALALALWDRAHDRISAAYAAGDDVELFRLYRVADLVGERLRTYGLDLGLDYELPEPQVEGWPWR